MHGPRGEPGTQHRSCRPRTTSRPSTSEIYKDVFSSRRPSATSPRASGASSSGSSRIGRCSRRRIGVGIDIPQQQPYPRMPAPAEDAPDDEHDADRRAARPTTPRPTRRRAPTRVSRRTCSRAASVFRRRHRLHGPFALYGGRIDPGKGCEELTRVLQQLREGRRRRDARADGRQADGAAGGAVRSASPACCRDSERLQALEAATVVVCRRPTRACRCWRSRRWRSARRSSSTRAARCSSSTASAATPGCSTPTATSSSSA